MQSSSLLQEMLLVVQFLSVVSIYDLSVFTDYNIDAPPSLKPTKKYSDISGLPVSNHIAKILTVLQRKNTSKSWIKHTVNTLLCLSSGKLHRPSDKATLHILWGVLLHPPPPHWCSYRLPGPSKGNLHRTVTAEQGLKPETVSNQNWTHLCVGSFWASLGTRSTGCSQRGNKGKDWSSQPKHLHCCL